jgi:Fe2+ or Zn2+ uptake regulation protein
VSTAYEQHNRRHRRLSVLRILAEAPGYTANDSLLGMVVNEFGIVSTRDQVRSELTWLSEQGFVTIKDVAGVMVATITEAGGEIAAGRRTDPGIAKSSPKAA